MAELTYKDIIANKRELAMLTVKEVLQDKVDLDVECVDRVYLNGYVKYLQMPGGVMEVPPKSCTT